MHFLSAITLLTLSYGATAAPRNNMPDRTTFVTPLMNTTNMALTSSPSTVVGHEILVNYIAGEERVNDLRMKSHLAGCKDVLARSDER
jgi:hypothetical protein